MNKNTVTTKNPRRAAALALSAALAVSGLAACGSDGDDAAESTTTEAPATTAAGAETTTTAAAEESTTTEAEGEPDFSGNDDPVLIAATEEYTTYVQEQFALVITDAKVFTDAVRSGDIEAAKDAYAPSRQAWERIEPIAALITDIDVPVDARVDDYSGTDDPTFTGWHRIEFHLWEEEDIEAAKPFADQLDVDLSALTQAGEELVLAPVLLPPGAAELIEEMAAEKISGEEDRYSHTDLWDFAGNMEGSQKIIELFTPALEEADPELLADINDGFDAIQTLLDEYADGDGYRPYTDITDEDLDAFKAALGEQAELMSQVNGALKLG